MAEQRSRRSAKTGLPPGTPVHVGVRRSEQTRITVIQYDGQHCDERQIASAGECPSVPGSPVVTWMNVDGVHDPEALQKLGDCLKLHPLVTEDILNTDERTKVEDYEDSLYIVLKSLSYGKRNGDLRTEQISLVLGENFLASFQEGSANLFEPVAQRVKAGRGRIERMGADYLAYTLIDSVVDQYFNVLEEVEERTERLEEELIRNATEQTLRKIHGLRRDLITLRKAIWPLREVVGFLQRGESSLVREGTRVYLRDVYDHAVHAIDSIESLRDIVSAMLDIYLSGVSNRLNSIMKVLTVIATIFMPLTWIAGVYGMNFHHMPELSWRWGYPLVMAVQIGIGVAMLAYFRKKRWL